MKTCILINSYPINDFKEDMLYQQVLNLKSTNLPIILCSGCEVSHRIYKLVDYIIINKNKIVKPALFQKKKYLEGKDYVSMYNGDNIVMFNDTIDLTITENIKLLFNIAKFFGFKTALYTEDDNIFSTDDEYIKNNIELLNGGTIKMCAFITKFVDTKMGIHTTHFFSNVDFFIENFKYPHNLNDLASSDWLEPWQCYEMCIYKCFEPHLKYIKILDINEDGKFIKSIFQRDNDVNYIANQRFTFIKLKNDQVRAYINNTSSNLYLNMSITTKTSHVVQTEFNPRNWYMTEPIEFGDTVKLKILDKSLNITAHREITYDSEDKILCLEL